MALPIHGNVQTRLHRLNGNDSKAHRNKVEQSWGVIEQYTHDKNISTHHHHTQSCVHKAETYIRPSRCVLLFWQVSVLFLLFLHLKK